MALRSILLMIYLFLFSFSFCSDGGNGASYYEADGPESCRQGYFYADCLSAKYCIKLPAGVSLPISDGASAGQVARAAADVCTYSCVPPGEMHDGIDYWTFDSGTGGDITTPLCEVRVHKDDGRVEILMLG